MKGLIVDDEAKSRSMLAKLCETYCPGLEIIGEASSVSEAKLFIDNHQPEVVFLDIRMPVESGFSLLKYYKDHPPFSVIFTTAYDEYALKAFKLSAVDYLLKPIEIDMLKEAFEKVKRRRKVSGDDQRLQKLRANIDLRPFDKLALPILEGYVFVKFDDIVRCEAQGNYTQVHFRDNKSILITKTLKHYEDILEIKGFFRVHKSHLINLKHIRKFLKVKQNQIEMSDGASIEVSPLKKDDFLARLSLER